MGIGLFFRNTGTLSLLCLLFSIPLAHGAMPPDTVRAHPDSVEAEELLEQAIVTAEKPFVRVRDGVFVYKASDIAEKRAVDTAWDLLERIPGVLSDGSSLTLVGGRKLKVMIDGKVSTMDSGQLYAVLSNMPASRVKEAELIYNAPAEYHVRGSVINLVTKTPTERSVSGQITAGYTGRYYSSEQLRGNLFIASPKSDLDLMYSMNAGKTYDGMELSSMHDIDNVLYEIHQLQEYRNEFWTHNVRAAFRHRFNKKNSLDVSYNGQFAPDSDTRCLTEGSFQSSLSNISIDSHLHNVSARARLGIGLTLNLDYTNYSSKISQLLETSYSSGDFGKVETTGSQGINRIFFTADKIHTPKSGWKLGYGLSYKYVEDNDNLSYLAASDSYSVSDTDSCLGEHTAGLYLSVSGQLKPGLTFSASLKGEYYKIGDYEKYALYPQFSVTYFKNPLHIFQLGLSTDKNYPSYWSKNASISYLDGYSEQWGSPTIRPATVYNLNATYVLRSKYSFTLAFSHIDNLFAQTAYQSPERLAMIYQYLNWDYYQTLSLQATTPFKSGNWLGGNFTLAGVYAHSLCNEFYDISFDREKLYLTGILNGTFTASKGLSFEMKAAFQTPTSQGLVDCDTIAYLDLGAKWKFAKDHLTLTCNLRDLFNTSGSRFSVDYKGQDYDLDKNLNTRSLIVKLSYRFGRYKEKTVKEVDTSRFGH